MSERMITDEMLTAFLDGALDGEEAAQIEATLAGSPDLQARLAALDVPLDDIRGAFDDVLVAAPNAPVLEPATRRSFVPAAAVAAALVAGIGMGGLLFRQTPPDWTEVVANYQSLYVSQTLSSPPMPKAEQTRVVTNLSGQLGVDLLPLVGLEDIEFRRAQMLGYNNNPLVQMAYLAPGGVPVAICVTPISGADSAVTQSRMFGMEAVSWTKDGHGFLIIGGEDAALIRQLADKVRATL